MIEEGKDKLEWTRQVSLGMTKMMMVMMMVMISLMQLKSNEKSKHYGHGGILADFRLTQPSWTLWRSWSPARTTRTTCRRSSGPSTSLPSWPTLVQLSTLDFANIKNCFVKNQNEILQTCLVVRSRTTQWGNLPPRHWWRFSLLRLNRWSVIALFVIIFFCHYLFFVVIFFYYLFLSLYFCHYLLML